MHNFDGDNEPDDEEKYLCPIYGGDNGYEWVEYDTADEYEYFHDFDSYFRFMKRLPRLRRLMDRGEFVGNDVVDPLFDT